MEEIMTHYDAQKPDEFGCKICDHVLLNIEKVMHTKDFSVKSQRLQTDGDTYLHAIEEFRKLKEVMPIADPKFSKDQWGISNLSKPDGVWVIAVCTADGQCRARVPVFVEVDSGNEGKFKKQPRVMAMKMWQHVAVGHWIPKASVVATLRIETQLVSKVLVRKANEGRDGLTLDTLIIQHLHSLTGAVAEILYGITLSCVVANCATQLTPKDWQYDYDERFFKHLLPSMQGKERRDFHFFVGPFGIKAFDLSTDRKLPPCAEPKPDNIDNFPGVQIQNDISEKQKETFKGAAFKDFESYFKKNGNNPLFRKYTGKRTDGDDSARFLDQFWDLQKAWTCEMGCQEKEFGQNSALTNVNFGYSRVPMHCVHVKRTDTSALVVPGLDNSTGTVQGVPVDMPNDMFYIDDIFTTLDIFIRQAHLSGFKTGLETNKATEGWWFSRQSPPTMSQMDENTLYEMLSKSFNVDVRSNLLTDKPNLNKALVRIPPSYSYTDLTLSRNTDQPYVEFFFSWSGFHLFVEPFIGAMENTLFQITRSTAEATPDFQSFSKPMTEFKRKIARGEIQLDVTRKAVTFPVEWDKLAKKNKAKSFNLASRCLYSYTNEIELDAELMNYLYSTARTGHEKVGMQPRTLNSEYLVLACQWFKCPDKPSLSALVRHYMSNDQTRKSIDVKLAGFPEGVRSEILFMFEVVFSDTQFLVKKQHKAATLPMLAFHDSDLEQGLVRIYVRVHWLPFELVVNFDRMAWQSENVYNMTNKTWQNIDIAMKVVPDVQESTLKSKNLVLPRFGGKIQMWIKPSMEGGRLWSTKIRGDETIEYADALLFDQEHKDRTRLLRALSLTNLQMSDWEDIENGDALRNKCKGEVSRNPDREPNRNLSDVRTWVITKFALALAPANNFTDFTRPQNVQNYIDNPPRADRRVDRVTAIERLKPERNLDGSPVKVNGVERLEKPKYSKTGVIGQEDMIRNVLSGCKIDFEVLSLTENLSIEKYFKWCESTHDYRFFTYDNCQLKLPSRGVLPNGRRDVQCEEHADKQLIIYEHDPDNRTIPPLYRKDIILHEALGTYFGVGYPSREKRAKVRYYLHQRFPILTKRYLPYKVFMQGLLSKHYDKDKGNPWTHRTLNTNVTSNYNKFECAKEFIHDFVHAVQKYQEKMNRVTFQDDQLEDAKKNELGAIKQRIDIANFFFHNNQVFARHLHIVWTWKWLAVKASCIHSYRDWYIHKHWYDRDEARFRVQEARRFNREAAELLRKYNDLDTAGGLAENVQVALTTTIEKLNTECTTLNDQSGRARGVFDAMRRRIYEIRDPQTRDREGRFVEVISTNYTQIEDCYKKCKDADASVTQLRKEFERVYPGAAAP